MGLHNYKTCDVCGRIISEAKRREDYYTATIRIVSKGVQYRHPTCYLCVDCFRKSNLPLFPNGGEQHEQH